MALFPRARSTVGLDIGSGYITLRDNEIPLVVAWLDGYYNGGAS